MEHAGCSIMPYWWVWLYQKYQNTFNAATVTHSCFCDDCHKTTAGAISVSFYWINTDLLLLSVLFFSLILAHLTVFLSFPVCQLPSIVTRVCAGGVSTVLCGAAVLNHTGFLSCMNRYLISLEPYQWTAIFSSFCVISWFILVAADCLYLNVHLTRYRHD